MRRVGGLFDVFTSFSHLLAAYRRARQGTRKNETTTAWFFYLEKELIQLQEELLCGSYQPGCYQHFQIYDPKERTISVAPFRDRVVHHALVGVLEPVYERSFIHRSYATRKNKGTHAAVTEAQQWIRKYPWFLKSDVDKYFDSISHDVLMALIERKVKDKRLLEVTNKIIRNGEKDQYGIGLPIGNLTSQFFANVYLNDFDHHVIEALRVPAYIRYMDDFVLFSSDRESLKEWRVDIESHLASSLKLQLKPGATFVNTAMNGLTFLGRRIFPACIRLSSPNLRRMTRRMQMRDRDYINGVITEAEWLQSMNSYWANLSYNGNIGLRHHLLRNE